MAASSEGLSWAAACVAKEWSKAIKIITSFLSQDPHSVSLLCNRAYCHNQLELHKHAIKDCNEALRLDPTAFHAYVYKGNALVALDKHHDALKVWRQGYGAIVDHHGDLNLLLELHALIRSVERENESNTIETTMTVVTSPTMTVMSPTMTVTSPTMTVTSPTMTATSPPSLAPCSPPKTPPQTPLKNDEAHKASKRKNERISAQSNSSTRSISLDLRLSRGIAQVNNGNYEQAITIFNQIIKDNPKSVEALLGRGTAYAFQRDLEAAIADFSNAIKIQPQTGEAWKRRGQARAASGDIANAVGDLTKALEFEPQSTDILQERGGVYFKSKDYESAVKDLRACVSIDTTRKAAYNILGLALVVIGEHKEGIEAHRKAVVLDPKFKDGWIQLAQSFHELGESEQAMECLERVLSIDKRCVNAYHLMGTVHHSLGDHKGAVKHLTQAIEIDAQNLECMYLRGSCMHAIGEFSNAVKDYDAVLAMQVGTTDKSTLQYLAYYQNEIALYTASKISSPFYKFDLDGDLHPKWKESWCQRQHPYHVAALNSLPPVKETLKSGRLKPLDLTFSKAKKLLLEEADKQGKLIQYHSPGFFKNKRQHRMAGLAALEIAQKLLNTWKLKKDNGFSINGGGYKTGKRARRRDSMSTVSHNRGGVCSSSSDTSCDHSEKSHRFIYGWHHLYSIAVKWRQISEPCDPVVWVNRLSEEEFNAGFGSHTPMLLGQARSVRYHPYFERAFSIAKRLMIEKQGVFNASNQLVELITPQKLKDIEAAQTCQDLYAVVGEDFWVVTPCCSSLDSKILEGTRLTLQRRKENGFDFSIRTPGTPSRWADYDTEMSSAWEVLSEAWAGESNGSLNLEQVQESILRLTFYWYNFMPLSRGTAVVGYVTMLGLFLAFGMEITSIIPQGLQVDWEAILSPKAEDFMELMRPWMCSSVKVQSNWQNLPDVSSTFPTTGSVIAALSMYE